MHTGRLNRAYYIQTSQGCVFAFEQFKFAHYLCMAVYPRVRKRTVTFTCHCYTRLDVKRAAEPAQKENT